MSPVCFDLFEDDLRSVWTGRDLFKLSWEDTFNHGRLPAMRCASLRSSPIFGSEGTRFMRRAPVFGQSPKANRVVFVSARHASYTCRLRNSFPVRTASRSCCRDTKRPESRPADLSVLSSARTAFKASSSTGEPSSGINLMIVDGKALMIGGLALLLARECPTRARRMNPVRRLQCEISTCVELRPTRDAAATKR